MSNNYSMIYLSLFDVPGMIDRGGVILCLFDDGGYYE